MSSLPHFRRMVIIGVGLIGGSLALVCREKGIVSEVVGVGRSEKNLQDAIALKASDRYTFKAEDAVKGADIIILAAPVRSLIRLAREIAPHLKAGKTLGFSHGFAILYGLVNRCGKHCSAG